jgi:preprotein translocase subunit SecE
MNAIESIKQPLTRSVEFLQECWIELKKVHWPNRKDTQQTTLIVIVAVTIVAIYLGVVDAILSWLIHRALSA